MDMSELKELEKCVKELHFLSDKLYSQFCEGELCTKCKLDIKNDDCILNKLIVTIDALEEKYLLDHKEKILTKFEKDYLSSTLHPFRKIIVTVSKHRLNNDFEYIAIRVKSLKEDEEENMCFPAFKVGTMYKGMKLGRKYTVKELGL
jgi:hypothetical protein